MRRRLKDRQGRRIDGQEIHQLRAVLANEIRLLDDDAQSCRGLSCAQQASQCGDPRAAFELERRQALVENEQRIRQAARNLRKFFENADRLHNVVPMKATG